ncbi:hypothetical protein J8273_1121 [Carpediemonas membranifera]|uniref:Uncharacterized protein n=1 Tax=Carpediemonas membranifera TaxID=201153 RepID=A0A8J6BGU7_9EUKA|nr:hypothetical protein J8273_1121 [Carpediemonas membranifera]|eukprot:KAG9397212.1 hypothetical protein J8273_1121 [Carpediemonas membranifera]
MPLCSCNCCIYTECTDSRFTEFYVKSCRTCTATECGKTFDLCHHSESIIQSYCYNKENTVATLLIAIFLCIFAVLAILSCVRTILLVVRYYVRRIDADTKRKKIQKTAHSHSSSADTPSALPSNRFDDKTVVSSDGDVTTYQSANSVMKPADIIVSYDLVDETTPGQSDGPVGEEEMVQIEGDSQE